MATEKKPATSADERKAMRKAAAALRAQLALKHQFERIDQHEDVIRPMLEKIKAGKIDVELDPDDVLSIESGE
jgi:hypothetical protein